MILIAMLPIQNRCIDLLVNYADRLGMKVMLHIIQILTELQ